MKLYLVIEKADRIMGHPGDHDEVFSIWRVRENAEAEVTRLFEECGEDVTVEERETRD